MNQYKIMKKALLSAVLLFPFISLLSQIPLPENPRPDFERSLWINLNGEWNFRFDKDNTGEKEQWFLHPDFDQKIMVPFSWGAPLSGIQNKADIGWYSRQIDIPASWTGKRVFVVIGACDWRTTAWIDGQKLGFHQGGYTPFEFELTTLAVPGHPHTLVLRADDSEAPYKLEGKQGYGPAKGIWQTVYLEARGDNFFRVIHFTPDIDKSTVSVHSDLDKVLKTDAILQFSIKLPDGRDTLISRKVRKGAASYDVQFSLPKARLWSIDDPWLYETKTSLVINKTAMDEVAGYFGMRKISVLKLPGTDIPYVALNNKPVYLQLTLDQCYHPEGFYTYPSDAFMRDEILRSKKIGLNGNRLHIKVEIPRKLYWADKLGLLIMADVPNSWGEPGPAMRKEWEAAMQGMIERDYNHPAIFSWILFNETWGLFSKDKKRDHIYADSTATWVEQMYHAAKKLDPSRLVEDVSACNYDHVITDLNSWHAYLPGYGWKNLLKEVSDNTYPGSPWNFRKPSTQGDQPMINSECGNVWGYEGSTGDVDWSWDYHRMMNEFRMHPKIAGWLYTEHHDVINEWNGYYRYDRSEKETGLEDIVPGMSLNDLHSPFYLSAGDELCSEVLPGKEIRVPLYASFMSDACPGDSVYVKTELYGWDQLGNYRHFRSGMTPVPYKPWFNGNIAMLDITMPCIPCLAVLSMTLETATGMILHRNFATYLVTTGTSPREEPTTEGNSRLLLVRFAPGTYAASSWKTKTSDVMGGLKVWGDGSGFFEYHVPWPKGLKVSDIASSSLVLEASAKQLFGKDIPEKQQKDGDYMRGAGFHDPSLNPNSYPMTDSKTYPSFLTIRVNGEVAGEAYLNDDPADHRGILSWFSQPRNNKLDEAGSYGYLVHATLSPEVLKASEGKEIIIRFEVGNALPGGLAIYGERFGRYPLDPTLVFQLK